VSIPPEKLESIPPDGLYSLHFISSRHRLVSRRWYIGLEEYGFPFA
jgi:hypothetical protein